VQTLGSVIADLGITLNTLETGTGVNVVNTLNNALTNVSNLLTAPTGLLGTLAAASGNAQFISAVNSGNTQLNNGIDTLTNTLNSTLLTQVDNSVLTPVLTALAPLSCSLALFGDCNGSTANAGSLTSLIESLTDAIDLSMGSNTPSIGLISSLTDAISDAADENQTVVVTLLTTITTLPTTPNSGGNTGLLGSLPLVGGLLGGLI